MDLRIAYEGFTYSHASIMYNALQIPQISKIVQVGIRDFCEQEVAVVQQSKGRVLVNTDADMKTENFAGKTWEQQCDAIIATLPQKVCISFDIDGMHSSYCPNTGTPVPGGFSFEQATYLFNKLAASGKEIIGFDGTNECIEKIRYFLAHPLEAEIIGKNARNRFLKDYTIDKIWLNFFSNLNAIGLLNKN
jgi:agmatinase